MTKTNPSTHPPTHPLTHAPLCTFTSDLAKVVRATKTNLDALENRRGDSEGKRADFVHALDTAIAGRLAEVVVRKHSFPHFPR